MFDNEIDTLYINKYLGVDTTNIIQNVLEIESINK